MNEIQLNISRRVWRRLGSTVVVLGLLAGSAPAQSIAVQRQLGGNAPGLPATVNVSLNQTVLGTSLDLTGSSTLFCGVRCIYTFYAFYTLNPQPTPVPLLGGLLQVDNPVLLVASSGPLQRASVPISYTISTFVAVPRGLPPTWFFVQVLAQNYLYYGPDIYTMGPAAELVLRG